MGDAIGITRRHGPEYKRWIDRDDCLLYELQGICSDPRMLERLCASPEFLRPGYSADAESMSLPSINLTISQCCLIWVGGVELI